MTDCFFWICQLASVNASMLHMSDIKPELVNPNIPPIQGNSQKSLKPCGTGKEPGKRLRKKEKRNRHLNPALKEERTQSPAPVAEYQDPNVGILTFQQHTENVVKCENQLKEALSMLKKHLSSASSSECYSLQSIISHMRKLNDEIDCFVATRIRVIGVEKPDDPVCQEANVSEGDTTKMSSADGCLSESTDHTDTDSDDNSDFEDMDLLDLLQKPDTQSSYTEPTEELLEAIAR